MHSLFVIIGKKKFLTWTNKWIPLSSLQNLNECIRKCHKIYLYYLFICNYKSINRWLEVLISKSVDCEKLVTGKHRFECNLLLMTSKLYLEEESNKYAEVTKSKAAATNPLVMQHCDSSLLYIRSAWIQIP